MTFREFAEAVRALCGPGVYSTTKLEAVHGHSGDTFYHFSAYMSRPPTWTGAHKTPEDALAELKAIVEDTSAIEPEAINEDMADYTTPEETGE